jgi:hypothetical protein
MLPRSIPTVPGFDFAARLYPAKIVAEDYYGFIELPIGEEIAVVIADVSGKGVAAGLLMPSIEVALRLDAPRFPSTSDLLHHFQQRRLPDHRRTPVHFPLLRETLRPVTFLGIYKCGTQSAAPASRWHRPKSFG